MQKELREAVYRGEGIVVAGAHDQRHHLDEALGIKNKGQTSKANGLSFNYNGETLTTTFAFSDNVLQAELAGASAIGQFQLSHDPNCDQSNTRSKKQGNQASSENSSNCEPTDLLAAAFHNYGEGQSIYVGFDLLAQATALGEGSLFANVLTTSYSRSLLPKFIKIVGK